MSSLPVISVSFIQMPKKIMKTLNNSKVTSSSGPQDHFDKLYRECRVNLQPLDLSTLRVHKLPSLSIEKSMEIPKKPKRRWGKKMSSKPQPGLNSVKSDGRVIKRRPRKPRQSKQRASVRQMGLNRIILEPLKCPRTVELVQDPLVERTDANKILFTFALGLLPGKKDNLVVIETVNLADTKGKSRKEHLKDKWGRIPEAAKLNLRVEIKKRIEIVDNVIKSLDILDQENFKPTKVSAK